MMQRKDVKQVLNKVSDLQKIADMIIAGNANEDMGGESNQSKDKALLRCLATGLKEKEGELAKVATYIHPTSSLEQFRAHCGSDEENREEFFIHPVREVRLLLINRMRFESVEACEFAEEVINFILHRQKTTYMGGCYDRDLLDILLQNYLFRSKSEHKMDAGYEFQARAAEFVTSITLQEKYHTGSHLYDEVSKHIKNLMGKSLPVYKKAPSIKKMCERSLQEISKSLPYYSSAEWKMAERAVMVVVAAGDASFLPQMQELLELLKSKKLKSLEAEMHGNRTMIEHFKHKKEAVGHAAFLEEMVKELSEEIERRRLRNSEQ